MSHVQKTFVYSQTCTTSLSNYVQLLFFDMDVVVSMIGL